MRAHSVSHTLEGVRSVNITGHTSQNLPPASWHALGINYDGINRIGIVFEQEVTLRLDYIVLSGHDGWIYKVDTFIVQDNAVVIPLVSKLDHHGPFTVTFVHKDGLRDKLVFEIENWVGRHGGSLWPFPAGYGFSKGMSGQGGRHSATKIDLDYDDNTRIVAMELSYIRKIKRDPGVVVNEAWHLSRDRTCVAAVESALRAKDVDFLEDDVLKIHSDLKGKNDKLAATALLHYSLSADALRSLFDDAFERAVLYDYDDLISIAKNVNTPKEILEKIANSSDISWPPRKAAEVALGIDPYRHLKSRKH